MPGFSLFQMIAIIQLLDKCIRFQIRQAWSVIYSDKKMSLLVRYQLFVSQNTILV
jgi:hypothetical protein